MVGLPGSAEELRAEVRSFSPARSRRGLLPRDSWLGEHSPGVQPQAGGAGMARDDVAEALRWAQRDPPWSASSLRRSFWQRGPRWLRTGSRTVRAARASCATARRSRRSDFAGNAPRRVLLLDRYERTRERLGSRLRADGRRTGRRRVARQRHEDLDRGAHRSHHAIVLCRTSRQKSAIDTPASAS